MPAIDQRHRIAEAGIRKIRVFSIAPLQSIRFTLSF